MLKIVKEIFEKIFIPNIAVAEITLQSLKLKLSRDITEQNEALINELLVYVSDMGSIHSGYIEKFCIARVSDQILLSYPVNIAESFILAYLFLYKSENLRTLYFRLGSSGLLTPTTINNVRVEDSEAIAQFVITSLKTAKLIAIKNDMASLDEFNL